MIQSFLASGDRLEFLRNLRTFDLRCLITDLRRWPFPNATERTVALELAATFGLQEHSHNKHVVATACGALLDCNQVTFVVGALRVHCELVATSCHMLKVLGRTLGMRGRRNSCAEAFRLAEQVEGGQVLAAREVQWLHARLGDGFLGAPDPYEPWPQGPQALQRAERFEGILPVPDLAGYSVRMVSSKTQLERFAQLKVCVNDDRMRPRILSGELHCIGIERDGHAHEVLVVYGRGGGLFDWRGFDNCAADATTRPLIERYLVQLGAMNSNSAVVPRW